MDWLKNVHFYRKIPKDLTEATLAGGGISVVSSVAMAYLFISSFIGYMSVTTTTQVVVDESDDQKLHINFNVSFPHLPCRWASVDISDAMGTHVMNISKNVHKFRLNADGEVVSRAAMHNREPVYEELASEDDEGDRAPAKRAGATEELNAGSFDAQVKNYKLVMVNFYAPWCPWSQRLNPVWEATNALLASKSYADQVLMAKVDCTAHESHALCHQHHVHAFPTVRIYREHNAHSHENYVGDRTTDALIQFIDGNAPHAEAPKHKRAQPADAVEKGVVGPEGCMILGFVAVNRVPGNLFFTAHSKSHSFNISKMNLSHHIEDISFGKMLSKRERRALSEEVRNQWNLLHDTDFSSIRENVTMEHYLKVVHTEYALLHESKIHTYQYTVANNIFHDDAVMPAALFSYDISPMQVMVQEGRESLAIFLTQTCAIIGGVFTVAGLFDAFVYHGGNIVKQKMGLGKQL